MTGQKIAHDGEKVKSTRTKVLEYHLHTLYL